MIVLSLSLAIVDLMIRIFLPAWRELRNGSDAQRLYIDETFIRDPRFFGKSLRRFLASRAVGDGHALIGVLSKAYVRDSVTAGDAARITALAADGSIFLGSGSRVTHWIDAERDIVVSENCFLGKSASSQTRVQLGRGTVFTRLFGRPIMTEPSSQLSGTIPASLGGVVLHDVISEKSIRIVAGAQVSGSIKSHGSIEILQGARVTGNIFARGAIHLYRDVAVTGVIFAEGDVRCDDHVEIGTYGAYVSIFSGGRMRISRGVRVFGWIIADGGGSVQ
jgi:cytoskeletal protein CcmA (bactofilin family)